MTPRRRAVVLLNPAAGHGTARGKYALVRSEVANQLEPSTIELDRRGDWKQVVRRELECGTRICIAAGGDGTVNALTSELVVSGLPLSELVLGAIGLGSSNDFHKPVRRNLAGVPLRIDPSLARPRDVVRVRYRDPRGVERSLFFIVSASLGVTADANQRFNHGDALLRWLKRRWLGAAIGYAAVRTLLCHRSRTMRLTIDGFSHTCAVANLGVMKTPYLSGSLRYDTPVEPDSGLFAVNLCEARGRARLLGTLAALARGRFRGRGGTRHWMASCLGVESEQAMVLELDGETVRARSAYFEPLPERLMACN